MNMMTAPFALPTLADKAMIVRLKIGRFHPYRRDDKATAQVELSNGVSKVGNFNKRLLKGSALLEQTNQAFNAVYIYHVQNSVPWLDDGVRMIPAENYLTYTQEIRQLIHTAQQAAKHLEANWQNEVAKDLVRLGPLADSTDYPSNIDGAFYVDGPRFQPIPTEGDFRVSISDEDKESLRKCIEEAEQGVSQYLIKELMAPVQKMVEKLSVPIGEEGGIFRDTLVTNVADMVFRLGKLNINNDPAVNTIITEVSQAISGVYIQPDVLRESQAQREITKDKLADVMAKMGAFMGAG